MHHLEERSAFRTYVEKAGYLRVYIRPYRSHAGRQGVIRVMELAREIESTQLSRRLPSRPVPDEIGRLIDTFNQMIGRLETSFESMKRFTSSSRERTAAVSPSSSSR